MINCQFSSIGKLVGQFILTLSANGEPIEAYIQLSGNPLYLTEIHLYIGTTIVPIIKGSYDLSPGRFPFTKSLNGYHEYYDLTNIITNFTVLPSYVVLHTTVCGIPF
jgi:hypothetical protein